MSEEAKPLTAAQESLLRKSEFWGLRNVIAAQIWATLDAERAKVEALRDEKAAVEWMLEQDRAALAAAVTRATAAEAKAEKLREASQRAIDHLAGGPTNDWSETAQRILRAALAKEKPDAGEQKDPANG